MYLFFSPTNFYSIYLRVLQSRGCPYPIISCMELKCWWTQRNVLNWSSWLLISKDDHCWKNWCLQQASILHLIVQVIKKDPLWVPLICRDLDITCNTGFLVGAKAIFFWTWNDCTWTKLRRWKRMEENIRIWLVLANSLKLEKSVVYGWFREHSTHSLLKKDYWK